MKDALQVTNLSVSLNRMSDSLELVKGISFSLKTGSILGVVGESGSGKSLTALALMNLLDKKVMAVSGNVELITGDTTVDLLSASYESLAGLRGSEIAMVFQEPLTSINPNKKCGNQLVEIIMVHRSLIKSEAEAEALRLMVDVGLEEPTRIMNSYPHQLSGGQLQRVIIAMAICGNPRILIADEPTTSLDVTSQKEILILLKSLQRRLGMSCIFISHDPMVIAEITDEVIVMDKGLIVESGATDEIIKNPSEEYTRSLLESRTIPLNQTVETTHKGERILIIKDLIKSYQLNRNPLFNGNVFINALSNVSITINKGKIHGIVGESGSGKSTLAKCLVGLEIPDQGEIIFQSQSVYSDQLYRLDRKKIQMIFQDPYGSLNPRMKVGASIYEVLKIHNRKVSRVELKLRVLSLFTQVGLEESMVHRYPHQLSGGQRQRVAIARAIAVGPDILICDEAVSALDIPVQAQILQLLISLKDKYNLTIIFISHDLSVIRSICDRVTVLFKGRVEEEGAVVDIFNHPQTEYTKTLISSIPGKNYLI